MTITTAKRFTIAEYHRLAELGFFGEDERVELIKGELFQMPAKGTQHSTFNRRLIRELSRLLGDRATIQSQDPVVIPNNSEPEPDIAILRNREDDYLDAHPNPSDVLLLIEIADSSLKYDQEVKLPIYAEGGISDYWIFNLVDNFLEFYSEPYQVQGKFGYRRKLIFLPHESVNLPFFPDLVIHLSKVFPQVKHQA
ncbi:Uma2 family endonuclease [Iningainema tapete]|uniref:Uma2 family endonuclease n=1 Tax=Iningainema tapete BLCC-T55 TaxID=2748662 RepID=A0A8J7CF89_9CYAN|nr:Uma2 family endonuclease [Iningainema tapete]MBD2774495.1 Uma2 family endonuclease [Iningainema tapete BLCC-T55]